MASVDICQSLPLENCHIGEEQYSNSSNTDVFQTYMLNRVLQHNPWWLKDAPSWCKDHHLSNEIMAGKASECWGNSAWEEVLHGLQQSDGILCPMELAVDNVIGRHLIAQRNIAPGEMLLVEPPLLLGLRARSPAYCNTCFKLADTFTCSECGFFFCGHECLTDSHKNGECLILRGFGFAEEARQRQEDEKLMLERLASMDPEQQAQARVFLQQAQSTAALERRYKVLQQYCTIPIIRSLIAMNQNELLKTMILSLQGNINEKSVRYRHNSRLIVDVIVNKLKVNIDPKLVHQICAIWDTNAFDVSLIWKTRVHGLYPFASLLTHDCQGNIQQWFTNTGKIVLRAVKHISKGELLTISYTDPQWSTMIRQDHLKISKQFTCTCKRCADPTECGTFLGSPSCPNCRGLLISSDPLDPAAQWICNKGCSHVATAKDVGKVVVTISQELKGVDPNNIQGINNLADNLEKQLHPTHHVVLRLHVSNLTHLASRNLSELSDEELMYMTNMASVVMGIARKIEPPLTRFTVRMGREDLRLRLETLKRRKACGHSVKEQLMEMAQQVKDYEFVIGWDTRMDEFASVVNLYQTLLNDSS